MMTRRALALSTQAPGPRRVFAVLLVAVVALAVFFSGRSYYFCVAVQEVVEHACESDDCSAHGAEDDQGPSVGEDCCEEHQVGELPPAHKRVELPQVPPAPVTTLPGEGVPAAFGPPRGSRYLAPLPRIVARPALPRAGPRSSAERCIALQVFHC
ncbi:hypothetical protein [Polyangium mundeleinium]|uniref:Secreted protein n=1 Tax=Polyangium mundeleinium TaxID=2995306 RepID=A0ABT5EVH5_9BACT|nr:hypothetical protein [Polyangium mundeleinium]MDC0745835.1 hypothetical protein [Polyangium mundeleinium]